MNASRLSGDSGRLRPILRSSSALPLEVWSQSSDSDVSEGSVGSEQEVPTPTLRRSSGSCIEFGTASGLPRLARTVSWCDDSGAPLEHVRTVDRRKKPAGFLAQIAVLKDEIIWSFTRPAVSENGEAAVTEDCALASLEVARQNAVTNVHLVRSLAENLP